MQRPTLSRRFEIGQSLLACDDDDHDAKSKAAMIRKQDAALRKATFGALILGFTFLLFYLNSTTVSTQPTGLQQVQGQVQTNVRGRDDTSEPAAVSPAVDEQTPFEHRRSELVAERARVAAHNRPIQVEAAAAAATPAAPAEPVTDKAPAVIEPLNCRDFIKQVTAGTFPLDIHDPNNKKHHILSFSRMTTTKHPFRISLHSKQADKIRWALYKKGHYYEYDLERLWNNILKRSNPGARVLDVGGNIGYYSLVSASSGAFKIDSFEPVMKNNLRFCESLGMNGWESERDPVPGKKARPSVNIWPMGVSDTSGTLEFIEANGNPGAGRFGGLGNDRTDFKKLPVTTLDIFAEERGWFESEPEIAILKVDVEGHEGHVLLGAEKLLRAKIVQNIFMEVWLDEPETRNGKVRALELLIEAGYKLNGQGGWLGPGKHSLWPDDENLAKNIFASLEKENWPSRNLWWTL